MLNDKLILGLRYSFFFDTVKRKYKFSVRIEGDDSRISVQRFFVPNYQK